MTVVFRVLSILHYNCRGPGTHHCLSWPTKTRQYGGENVPAFSLWWDVANPRTTMPFFSCIRTFLRASFLTGFQPLYGFRNLIYCWLHQMEQLLLARTKKEFIYIGFLAQSSNFSCQTLRDCLCTFDAFHISNSIRYFWASVCVCVCDHQCLCVCACVCMGVRVLHVNMPAFDSHVPFSDLKAAPCPWPHALNRPNAFAAFACLGIGNNVKLLQGVSSSELFLRETKPVTRGLYWPWHLSAQLHFTTEVLFQQKMHR